MALVIMISQQLLKHWERSCNIQNEVSLLSLLKLHTIVDLNTTYGNLIVLKLQLRSMLILFSICNQSLCVSMLKENLEQ